MLAAGGGLGCPEGHDRAARRDRHLRADCLRQVRCRRARRGASRDGSRLGRRVAGLSRACRSSPTSRRRRLCWWRSWISTEEMSVGAFATLAHTRGGRPRRTERRSGGLGRDGLVPACRPRRAGASRGPPEASERARVEASYDADPAATYARLAALDPRAAKVVHPNDRRRVVRALELAEVGSSLVPEIDRLWSEELRRPTIVFGLDAAARRSRAPNPLTNGRDVPARGRRRGAHRARRGPFRAPPRRHWGCASSPSSPPTRRSNGS